MKKYFVIGNPINHSLSPKLHNYWIKKNKIDAIYEKKLLTKGDLEKIISTLFMANKSLKKTKLEISLKILRSKK